jgi:hypothetical protein
MDDVQPGKIMGRRGHVWEGHFKEAPGTGGVSEGGWQGLGYLQRAWQATQGGLVDMTTPKHGENCSIFRGGLQVPLPIEREGLLRPASQRPTTLEDVLIHILGNAVTGGPRTQAGDSGAEYIRYGTDTHQ